MIGAIRVPDYIFSKISILKDSLFLPFFFFSFPFIVQEPRKETVDGIRPRPFNEVHEIHKPSRELGRLGYAVTKRGYK